MSKDILICGAGSVGMYLGLRLYAGGHQVSLFGGRKLKAINGGFIFINSKKYVVPAVFSDLPVDKRYDFLFITTKLYDTRAILKKIKHNNINASILVSIQNGIVDNTIFNSLLEGKKLHVMAIFEGLNLLGNKLTMTPTDMGWRTEYSLEARQISNLLCGAGINCIADPGLERVRAEKSIVNCCLNALSAIENATFKQLFSNQGILDRINRLFNECYLILSGKFDLDKASEIYSRMFLTWKGMPHYSSTWQDAHDKNRNKTEIDFLNGYMINLAHEQGLPASENEKILQDFKRLGF